VLMATDDAIRWRNMMLRTSVICTGTGRVELYLLYRPYCRVDQATGVAIAGSSGHDEKQ
jgi:hypothetical protein